MSKGAKHNCVWDKKRARSDPGIKVRLLKEVGTLPVYLVRGRYIRGWNSKPIYLDFTEGGNYMAYPEMPREIWIDDCNEAEWMAVYLHEITEVNDMEETGDDYEVAHEDHANVEEEKGRNDIGRLEMLIQVQEKRYLACHERHKSASFRDAIKGT